MNWALSVNNSKTVYAQLEIVTTSERSCGCDGDCYYAICSPEMSVSPPQPPQVIVITQPPAGAAGQRQAIVPKYKAKLSHQLGISVLVMAGLSMAFGIAGLVIQTFRYTRHDCDYSNWAAYVATGIWCGFWVSNI